MNDSDNFFGSARTPQDDASRPRAVNPRTGQVQDWQRASNYAAPLDNPHGLIKWKMRELIKGISLRPDLARLLLTGAAIEDNAKADQIIEQAHAAVAIDSKANEGTAVHAALSRSFLGHEVPSEYEQHIRSFAAELQRNGLTPVATEVRLLCVLLGVLGHTDWIVKTADGRYLILDVKTGKLGDAKRKFSVQCKAYAGAEYIDDGNGGWAPIPFTIDQTEAILAHVDPQTGATALYRVDLVLGFYGATLAERARDWHKIEVLSPYTPVHPSIPVTGAQVVGTPVVSEIRPASVQQAIATGVPAFPADPSAPLGHPDNPQTRAEIHAGIQEVRDKHGIHPIEGTSGQDEAALRAMEQHAVAPVNPDASSPEAERAELMQPRNDKATLQRVASGLGLEDLAHNRQWLADWIIAKRRGLDDAACVAYAKSKGTIPLSGQVSASPQASPRVVDGVTQRPSTEDERQAGDLSFIFKSIEGARSEGALEALRANVVERRGDHAWTDEMASAARRRALELIGSDNNAVGPAERVMARIGAATESTQIAALWSEVTIGGSAPENWIEPFKNAANVRLTEIQTAQGAPPANPYGPQQ